MIVPEDPPGFVVRTEAQKAAAANGFRLEHGADNGWLCFRSTTAQVTVWIAGVSKSGPWLLSVSRPEVSAELSAVQTSLPSAPGVATYAFESLHELYGALDRAYRLGISLPNAPLSAFQTASQGMPRSTEAERLVVERVGQNVFRQALIAYWGGHCPLTGITDPELLRASHIVPWAECESDEKRLDVHNGLLLSALWDAAFDAGLVSFADDGTALASTRLKPDSALTLGISNVPQLAGLTSQHRANLAWHRSRYGFSGKT